MADWTEHGQKTSIATLEASDPIGDISELQSDVAAIETTLTPGASGVILQSNGSAIVQAKAVNANIDDAAAIAYGKLSLNGSVVAADLIAALQTLLTEANSCTFLQATAATLGATNFGAQGNLGCAHLAVRIDAVKVLFRGTPTGSDTMTYDILKNGSTILTTPFVINNTLSPNTLYSFSLSGTPTLAAGDSLQHSRTLVGTAANIGTNKLIVYYTFI